MSERPSYRWSYGLSFGLTASGGALAVVSVLAYFMPATLIPTDAARLLCVIAFAAMVGFSVACANCTAAAAQHALSRPERFYAWTFWPALICTLGFCVTTGIGVHLGWSLMTRGITSHELPDARIVTGAAVFIALAKPAMNWIIEGRKIIDKDASDAAETVENARLDAIRKAEIEARAQPNVTHLRPRHTHVRSVARGAVAIASMIALGDAQDASAAAPQTQAQPAPETQPDAQEEAPAPEVETRQQTHMPCLPAAPQTQRRRTSKRTKDDFDARCRQARTLLLQTPAPSNRKVAKATRLSASTVDRIAREVTPLRTSAAA